MPLVYRPLSSGLIRGTLTELKGWPLEAVVPAVASSRIQQRRQLRISGPICGEYWVPKQKRRRGRRFLSQLQRYVWTRIVTGAAGFPWVSLAVTVSVCHPLAT